MHFFCIFLPKNLVVSKKSSTFAVPKQNKMEIEQIIEKIVDKYIEQVDVFEKDQVIDVELYVDDVFIGYGSTLHTEGHHEYYYDVDFQCSQPVDYVIDVAVISDSSICFDGNEDIPDYIKSITAKMLDKEIEKRVTNL